MKKTYEEMTKEDLIINSVISILHESKEPYRSKAVRRLVEEMKDCKGCGACCSCNYRIPVLEKDRNVFVDKFVEKMSKEISGSSKYTHYIMPLEDGCCPAFDKEKKECTIYDYRPYNCSSFKMGCYMCISAIAEIIKDKDEAKAKNNRDCYSSSTLKWDEPPPSKS